MPNKLKELRLHNHLTLSELSQNVEIPVSTLSKYENQQRNIVGDNLQKLSGYFNVSIDTLLGNSEFGDVTLMVNLSDDDLMPFKTSNVETRDTTIAFNQVMKWLDSENNLLYSDKRKKDLYTHQQEIELIKTMHKIFGNMRDSFQVGMDRNLVKTENEYIKGLDQYKQAFNIFQKFFAMDKQSKKLMIELAEQFYQNNKKATDNN